MPLVSSLFSFGVLLWETLNRRQPCGGVSLFISVCSKNSSCFYQRRLGYTWPCIIQSQYCITFRICNTSCHCLNPGEDGVGSGLEGELLPKNVPHCHTLSRLMTSCWSTNPHSRPTAEGKSVCEGESEYRYTMVTRAAVPGL